MPLRIIRNDITKMNTDAIVNTASADIDVGAGCDYAVYNAAGFDELLKYRRDNIGKAKEGDAFVTPGFNLGARYIIHTVSPLYKDGMHGEEELLRLCYRNVFKLAKEKELVSIAIPLIATGGFGYPKEEGMRIAIDEINEFLIDNKLMIFLVVFDEKSSDIGRRFNPDLESYINRNYVDNKTFEEYAFPSAPAMSAALDDGKRRKTGGLFKNRRSFLAEADSMCEPVAKESTCNEFVDFESQHVSKLEERMKHMSDTFSQYLMYLIKNRNMENAEVYKRAIVDKKIFSKIKNNVNYHPQKITALCLCVGAKLNLDESKDLLSRAGYALSPCDKTDIIFSYFIENEIYDMIELDIQLEEHGLPCIIS